MKQSLAAGLFLILALCFSTALFAAESLSAETATYVGNEMCKACHAPQVEKFSKTMMGKIFLFNARNDLERQG